MAWPDDIQIRLRSGSSVTLNAKEDGSVIIKHGHPWFNIESKEVERIIQWLDDWAIENAKQT